MEKGGAVDGILIKVWCPWASEVGLPRSFYSRKGFFAINVQAVCDVRKRFIFVGMDMPGSSHDARAFGMCALWEAIQLGFIARGFYLLGDAAYRGICEFSALRIGRLYPACAQLEAPGNHLLDAVVRRRLFWSFFWRRWPLEVGARCGEGALSSY